MKKLNPIELSTVLAGSVAIGLLLKHFFKGDWFEFIGFTTGLVGVYLVSKESVLNWPVGIVNVATYAWVFFTAKLYADMSLQLFFFALLVHGWYQWVRGGANHSTLTISRIQPANWKHIVFAFVALTLVYYPVIKHFNGAAPFVDSALTVISIIAQVLLNRKKLENWLLWILVDIAYIPLYISRQLYSTAVLYFLFLLLATSGWFAWKKTYALESSA